MCSFVLGKDFACLDCHEQNVKDEKIISCAFGVDPLIVLAALFHAFNDHFFSLRISSLLKLGVLCCL